MMKRVILCLMGMMVCYWGKLQAADTVRVLEAGIPVLIERNDNVVFYLRIDGESGSTMNGVKVKFGEEVDLSRIAAVKLYYSGTKRLKPEEKNVMRVMQYVPSNVPGKTLKAHPSYSVLKSIVKHPKREVVLECNQTLFAGPDFYWISIQMDPKTPLDTKLTLSLEEVRIDQKPSELLHLSGKGFVHRMGIGVRHAGDDGSAAFRIPGLVTTNSGTLLGVYDIRYNSSADLQEHIDIGLSRSTDGGQTWEKMRIPMTFGEDEGLPKGQNGVGDPAILVDEKSGNIWIVAAWTHGIGGQRAWGNSGQGMDKHETAQLVMVKSEDDGKTWSEPINVTKQLKDPSWYFLLQGPGRGITMEDGTLVFAMQYIGADRIPNAGIMYSKDQGKSWHLHQHARTNTTEAQVAEIEPGVLMLNMRDNRGGSRAVSITKDMGKTWTEHPSSRSALQEPICMASLLQVKAEENVLKKDILLFSNPNTVKGRNHITIKASLDGGFTWLPEHQVLLDTEEGWGYSCLTLIDEETIGILYESSVAHMTFQVVKLKDLIP